MVNIGYCCINTTLAKDGITIGRGMIKRTFEAKGIKYAGELAEANIRDMIEIIKWNEKQGIKMYRMSSDMFPWMSEYKFEDLPNFGTINNLLKGAGSLAHRYGQRLTFHPGPFDVLASANPKVVQKTIADLNAHGKIMDLMGLPRTPYSAINIHVNTTQGGKDAAMQRFCDNFQLLDDSVKSRLVVENDDKESQYTTEDLFAGIHSKIGIPITFDYHHHRFNSGGLTEEQALRLAASTWDCEQLVHYSSCKKTFEDPASKALAHADWVYEKIKTYGLYLDIELEAKAKELAVFDYNRRKNDKSLLNDYIEL